MGVDWAQVALVLAVLVPSVILHEVSHGVVALWLGDDTAKQAGRLTLNPLPHIDPIGTVLLPIILSLGGLGAFGYAKPVPVRPNRLRNPRQHSMYVSLVGPAVNIVLAVAAALAFRVLYRDSGALFLSDLPVAGRALFLFGFINVILAVFNLLPIPPLDGSAMIERVLPTSWWPAWLRVRQYSIGIILIVVLVFPGGLSRVFDPALSLWRGLL
ncbi:MAG TPA: site-2 protease family protein [Acidimicrobiales bacterium]|nr:site-2 protease family protein [Acidimicrobiales bacterium]